MFRLVFLLLFISCARFIDLIEPDDPIGPTDRTNVTPPDRGTCELNEVQFFNKDKKNLSEYQNFIKRIPKSIRASLNLIDHAILYSLHQLQMRADIVTPNAEIKILQINQLNAQLDRFSAKTDSKSSFSYLYGLEQLIKKYQRPALGWYFDLIEQFYPLSTPVLAPMASFLEQHAEQLISMATKSKKFVRGDDPLREGERLKRLPFKGLYQKYRSQNKQIVQPEKDLTKFEIDRQRSMACNFNMQQYQKNIYDRYEQTVHSYSFGLKQGNQIILIVVDSHIEQIQFLSSELDFFLSGTVDRGAAFCRFESGLGQFWMASLKGKDPAQYLAHLVQYDLFKVENSAQFDQLINFPRHLVLQDPLRIVYESRRGSQRQLKEFLKMNIPVYHSPSLGEIIGVYSLNKRPYRFVIDQRSSAGLSCQKTSGQ
jgi:hypothetical protein